MNQKQQPNFQQLMTNKDALQQLANSPEAKALAKMLTQGQDQASLQKMAQEAVQGNTQQLSQLVQSITGSPGGAELLKRLSKSLEGK